MLERPDDATRQYIDAVATFEAYEEALAEAGQVRGGMYGTRVQPRPLTIRTWCAPARPAAKEVWALGRRKRRPCTPASVRERSWPRRVATA